MDWEVVAYALAAIVAALVGLLWGRMASDMARTAEKLAEVAQLVHGHSIMIEDLRKEVRGHE